MKKGCLVAIVGVIVGLALIGGILSLFDGDDKVAIAPGNNDEQIDDEIDPKEDEEDIVVELSIEQLVEKEIIKQLKTETNMGLPRIVEITVGEELFIELNASENFTVNMTKTGILLNTKELFAALFAMDDINIVTISWQLPLVDTYGNEELDRVMLISMGVETAGKVNWENVLTDNIPVIADSYWEHPAFQN